MQYNIAPFYLLILLLALPACAPQQQAYLPRDQPPKLEKSIFIAADGSAMDYRSWNVKKPKAVILALHGFNDYSHAFRLFGEYLKPHRIALYAYDQRGFGTSKPTGIWAGEENLTQDTLEFLHVLHQRYKDVPLYLLGESMGGAVAISAVSAQPDLPINGLILAAPAVWGEDSFNILFRSSLWIATHIVPGWKLTGEGLEIQATDNIEVLQEMGRDPLIIKETRMDAIYGLVNLMDDAHAEARNCELPVLVLYGLKDMVIPREPVDETVDEFRQASYLSYPEGYHMLLRDKQRHNVFNDIVEWIEEQPERQANEFE